MTLPNLEIRVDERKLKGIERMLVGIPRGLPKVITRALNKTGAHARTETVRAITRKVAMRQTDVRKDVTLRRASWRYWVATIRIKGRRVPLIRFGARQVKRGTTYKIERGGGRATAPHAFIATMPSGHVGVFKRKAGPRLPIGELKGPSVVSVFEKAPGLAARMMADAGRRLETEMDRQVGVLLAKGR
ncbi:MAG TPA: phage tail protein [Phycisphaerae bacterium]|nr:phage tail protein [Phycisphaerae bacterium]